jgi:hypothetical protein
MPSRPEGAYPNHRRAIPDTSACRDTVPHGIADYGLLGNFMQEIAEDSRADSFIKQ